MQNSIYLVLKYKTDISIDIAVFSPGKNQFQISQSVAA